MSTPSASGPLAGLRVVELAGLGPGPMCAMLLSDLGAEVLRIDRVATADLGAEYDYRYDLLNRGRRSVAVDLKDPEGIELIVRLTEQADVLIETFRPGVAERMGLGPDQCFEHNRRLIYARMTGWGREGPLAMAAGHDINYIALTGALHAIGERGGPPIPPLNLVGNVGGGALYLALGICAAIVERVSSGIGQVVDAAMVDGAASMMTAVYGLKAVGLHAAERGANVVDGGAHFYGTYQTSDGRWVAVGASETRFHRKLLETLGLTEEDIPDRFDASRWTEHRERIQKIIATKTRDEWCSLTEGSDACLAPVLSLDEAPDHPHMRARGTFVDVEGVMQPGPAPRFSRTPGAIQRGPSRPGADTESALLAWGVDQGEVERLIKQAVIGRPA